MQNAKWTWTVIVLLAAGLVSGCDNGENGGTGMKGVGKESPDAVYDALVKTMKDQDEKAYLDLVANSEDHESFGQILDAYSADGGREKALKLAFGASYGGTGADGPHKRFDVEIDGDNAVLIILRPNPLEEKDTQYLKYKFTKSGDLWYYVERSFGPVADIDQAKYKWDRSE